ncbi:hypothetical protein ADK78_39060 [Kitasatospora aureofaciens]|nr:hypothetical protein DF17_14910 [Streptomyces rimosus]KOG67841.1 hypothetical protein ADK78_39060 [Kitasatospora aureofaciens]KUJ25067.1 hypothetical protein ADK46_41575 [Streptomyces rimosus subsp. rimosus]
MPTTNVPRASTAPWKRQLPEAAEAADEAGAVGVLGALGAHGGGWDALLRGMRSPAQEMVPISTVCWDGETVPIGSI